MGNSVRYRSFLYLFFALWGLLLLRLVKIQILDHKQYLKQAEKNYIKPLRVPPLRGKILDRKGRVLADWKPIFRISVLGEKTTKEGLTELSGLLHVDIDPDTIIGKPGYIRIKDGASLEEVISVEEREDRFPWIVVSTVPTRRYLYGGPFFHLLGYTGEVGPSDLKRNPEFKPGDIIGKSGVEKKYEEVLRGKPGYRFYSVDATGKIIETDPRPPIPPVKGRDIVLTVDRDLQLYADSLFREYRRGVAVALDPRNGDILLFYSKPYVDPNVLSMGISQEEWKKLVERKDNPLLDRCIAGLYPPGSIFKLVTGAIALDLHLVNPQDRPVTCNGAYRMGNRIWRCWLPSGHGALDFYHAIEQSCDVYFYYLGQKIGLARFLKYVRNFGLQEKLGIDLPGEKGGFIPDMPWYEERYGKGRVPEGLVLNLAIGQGEILLTPLDLAFLTALIAMDSTATPHVLKVDKKSLSWHRAPVEREVLEHIRRGMYLVVNGEKGTGRSAQIEGIDVAGKTGTAQNPHGKEHALFAAYAPYRDPKIAIVVIVENAGHGGSYAAPIAGKLIERYLKDAEK